MAPAARTELFTSETMPSTSPAQGAQHLRSDEPSKRRRPASETVLEPEVRHAPLLHIHGQGRGPAREQDRGELREVGLVSNEGQGGDIAVGLHHLDAFGGGAAGLPKRLRVWGEPTRPLFSPPRST